jgi:hypothetical protein
MGYARTCGLAGFRIQRVDGIGRKQHPIRLAEQCDLTRSMAGNVDYAKTRDLLPVGDRPRDLRWSSIPSCVKSRDKLTHLLVFDQVEVSAAPAGIAFRIGQLIGVTVDRHAKLDRTSPMIYVAMAENQPLEPTASGRENFRTAPLDASVESDHTLRAVDLNRRAI